jgi:hypothetical protein
MFRTEPSPFRTDARIAVPHDTGCGCALHPPLQTRRLFTGLLAGGALGAALPALAQQSQTNVDEGVRRDVGKESKFTKLVPAEQVEQAAAQQYAQMLKQAQQQRALAPETHPQLQRLRYISQRLIPHAEPWNARAKQWRWEVNLLGSKDLNAFCMPGGKIAFYYGILSQLQLSDDEVATIMGHEIAHALREHARERMGKTAATRIGASLLADHEVQPRGRKRGRHRRHGGRGPRRLRPRGRRDAMAEDADRQQGRTARVHVHPPGGRDAHQGHPGQAAQGGADPRARLAARPPVRAAGQGGVVRAGAALRGRSYSLKS